MTKKEKTPFEILTEAVGLYFSNFDKFIKYMSFPIWGQIFGLGLIFVITFFYTQNLPKLINRYPNLSEPKYIIILSILVILPALMIYMKAFWEFLVSYGAINSMLDNMLKSGKVYDFEAHTQLIKRRSAAFVGLWFLLGIFSLIAIIPLFWIICGIFGVYFVLAFQIFTFEAEQSPIGCLKRSLTLILRHFGHTFLLICFAGGLTYLIIPQLAIKALDGLGIITLFAEWIKPLFNSLPVFELPNYGVITDIQIGAIVIQSLVAQVFIQYTLPLRSILWSLWYKELSCNKEPAIKKEKKVRKRRPSEKLMEESHKKYGKKKLDTNILRRAAEKKEEDN